MLNKELVPNLAEIWGVPFERAWTIDRALANAGLRRKWKGPNPPDMTRREALHFLLACMVTDRTTKAGEETAPFLGATGPAPFKPSPASDLEFGQDDETYHDRAVLFDALDPALAPFKSGHQDNPTVDLVNYLLVLCRLLDERMYDPGCIKLETCTSHPSVEISFSTVSGNTIFQTDYFFPEGESRFGALVDAPHQIRRSVSVYGEALLAIVARTTDPLEVQV